MATDYQYRIARTGAHAAKPGLRVCIQGLTRAGLVWCSKHKPDSEITAASRAFGYQAAMSFGKTIGHWPVGATEPDGASLPNWLAENPALTN